MEPYQTGERVYVSGEKCRIIRQVLFNHPAYKVSFRKNLKNSQSRVIDGEHLSRDPKHRSGLVQRSE